MNTATNPRTGPDTGQGTATGNTAQAGPGEGGAGDGLRRRMRQARLRSPPRRKRTRHCRPWTSAPGPRSCSTAWSARARRPSPPEGCPPRAGSGPRSWPPSTTATCSPGSGRLPPKQAPLPTPHSTAPEPGTAPGRCCSPAQSPRHHPQARLRRRHHPGRPRRRGPGPGHRPRLPHLPAPHPQGHHGPGPGLRLPAMHHPGPLVRGPPHHLLVPRRNHRNRQRHPALLPSPPRDPQGTLEHPDAHRHPLVHPATPPRPRPDTPPEHLLPSGVTPWPPRDRSPDGRVTVGVERQRPGRPGGTDTSAPTSSAPRRLRLVPPTRHRLHRAQYRLRLRHDPRRPRRRGPGPGHRPNLSASGGEAHPIT